MERAATMIEREDEESVIDGCRRGDVESQRLLFEAYKDRVYSIAFHFTGNEATAKDVTQQVFVKLMTNMHQYRTGASFSTWLYRLVANACVDEYRKHRHFAPFDDDAGAAIPAPGRADDALNERETAEAVRRAVGELAPKLRIAVLLRYFDDLSYEEIGEALGVSTGTVASRLSRGHRILARRLGPLRRALGFGGDR